jgi:hypothetical protein
MEIELIAGFTGVVITIIVTTASLAHWLGEEIY